MFGLFNFSDNFKWDHEVGDIVKATQYHNTPRIGKIIKRNRSFNGMKYNRQSYILTLYPDYKTKYFINFALGDTLEKVTELPGVYPDYKSNFIGFALGDTLKIEKIIPDGQ